MIESLAVPLATVAVWAEAKAWDEYVVGLLAHHETDFAVAEADRLLEARRARFGADKIKQRVLESAPDKAELRAIR